MRESRNTTHERLRDLEQAIIMERIHRESFVDQPFEMMVTFSLDFQTKLEVFAVMPLTSKTYQRTIFDVEYFLLIHQTEPFRVWSCTK